jgi:heptosyltransferase II
MMIYLKRTKISGNMKNLQPKNIIVRMPNWLGDVVMAIPVIEDLRHFWPDAKITAMCQSNVSPLLAENPHLNEIFSFKKPSGWIHRKQHLTIIDELKKGHYDLGILLTNSFSSAWKFWRGEVENRIGYRDHYRSFLLNEAVPFPANKDQQHLVITYKELLAPLGIPLSDTSPHLYLTPQEKKAALDFLCTRGIDPHTDLIIGINPGAAYGTAKCWPPDRFKSLTLKLLKAHNVRILYFGDQSGAPVVNEICHGLPDQVVNLAGKTSLRELIALIQVCSIFLTNDSGPMHIAAALGTELLALFGSTSDVKTGPYLSGKVIHKHVECSPCYKRVCPIDFRCMKRIEVDEVYQELLSILENEKKKN